MSGDETAITNIVGGWLLSAQRHNSDNADARPGEALIDLLVIHSISLPPGQFGGHDIHKLFTNQLEINAHPSYQSLQGLRVSAHVLIDRSGELFQFVAFDRRAWHAGQSSFAGQAGCNDFSIGIELEGGDLVPYTVVQYQQLIALTRQLMRHYPGISRERIVAHETIAPERKTDPGPAFDWPFFLKNL